MNSNTNHHDDPRLTAYALGELSGAEHEQVEALLRDDASARQVVDEIRAAAGLIANRLKDETNGPALSDEQRSVIARAASAKSTRREFRVRRLLVPALAAAALLVLCVGIFMPSLNRAREVAVIHRERGAEPFVPENPEPTRPTGDSASQPKGSSTPSRVDETQARQPKQQTNQELARVLAEQPSQSFQSPINASGAAANAPLEARGTKVAAAGPTARSPEARYAAGLQTTDGGQWDSALNGGGLLREEDDRDRSARRAYQPHNTEAYDRIIDNAFLDARQNPLSTFSIDVDTASYSNVRRFINEQSQLPPKDAVRIEEMVNYFPYSYPAPQGDAPFGAAIEVAGCPWNGEHRLVRVALKGREIAKENRPPSNLVFLIDVSGSMQPENKLPLLKRAMQRLVGELHENDRVAIVVYAGNSGLVLPSTTCDERNQRTILDALERLQAGGSTNGASGITLAYQVATENFIRNGTNRVILCTDGDFNVGGTKQGDLTRLIEDKAKSNVFLSVLGFGMGNVKDSTMEKLADKGNGNYAYIDNLREGNKVLVEQMSGTLITIAKDVKIQVEFNPARVGAYRLIGYENRMLAKEDFNDDKKDAGEIGAGHTVTALYEIAPVGARGDAPAVDPLKYGANRPPDANGNTDEMLTVKLRYKAPDAPIEQGTSKLLEFPVKDSGEEFARASRDFKFASSVAAFGMILRDSPYKGNATFDAVIELAQDGRDDDRAGYRGEFIELVRKAKTLQRH